MGLKEEVCVVELNQVLVPSHAVLAWKSAIAPGRISTVLIIVSLQEKMFFTIS